MWEAKVGGLWSKDVLGKCETLSEKYLKQKRAEGVAQSGRDLPGKLKALSSNPQYHQKKGWGSDYSQLDRCRILGLFYVFSIIFSVTYIFKYGVLVRLRKVGILAFCSVVI
jgi:hypothetical protein